MSTVLDEILAGVREDLAERERALPEAELRALAALAPAPLSLAKALREGPRPRVIAEVKRASPSRGPIAPRADAVRVAAGYRAAGAAAISVLTEGRRFGGSLEDLARVAAAVWDEVPVLRKDFVVGPYQILEARATGAAAVLLIAALLEGDRLRDSIAFGRDLGIESLVEVHDEADLERALGAGAAMVGVNNRDLATLAVSLETSVRLGPLLPPGVVRVAESGIGGRAEMDKLAAFGYDAFLIGERLMTESDPGAALGRLLAPERREGS